ncbi:TULP3 [Hepatospora eriocheir]|uniref:TULP3 n=1 Tax=Hepatospora eriocheir TaxID=1081669 RepID=A0A1X0Q7X5_9MICR|nr:TULP3 [Hepatospora eriocheir]
MLCIEYLNNLEIDFVKELNRLEKSTKSKIIFKSSLFNIYNYLHEDNTKVLPAKRTPTGYSIYAHNEGDSSNECFLIGRLRANIFGTKYSLELDNEPLHVNYDLAFLKKNKPRSFNVQLGHLNLENKYPIYNPDTNSYSLNFSGRVTIASAKNFQIIHKLDPTFITLTFRNENTNSYILDFTHPWSLIKEFCVGLTALDHKLGFE